MGNHCVRRRAAAPSTEAGFTIIEIMAVVIILGILATIVGTRVIGTTDTARRSAVKAQIRNFENALDQYKLDNFVYPTTEQGLSALVQAPSIGTSPPRYRQGGYMKSIPKDPWGNEYVYVSPGIHAEYDLESFGADGADGGDSDGVDIESWNLE